MTLGQLLALVAIIIGFFVGASSNSLVFSAINWFVAAIAIMLTIGGVGPTVVHTTRQAAQ